ncbi:MAG: YdcF family protein [Magnetococcales bacterium]|nr:YdcF family protein [Magnetococcales bacterium]
MNAIVYRFIEQIFLPPGVILTALVTILFLMRRTAVPRAVRVLLLATLCLTWIVSLPVTARLVADLVTPQDRFPPVTPERLRQADAQAIVIFGIGRAPRAPEYGDRDTLSASGLLRARYGAHLHRLTGLPILLAGGRPYDEEVSEAQLMREVLEREFATPVRWLDEESRNTWENAVNSVAILRREGIARVVLVIHARDAERALWSMRKAAGEEMGILIAPIQMRPGQPERMPLAAVLLGWVPNADAMNHLAVTLHEGLGLLWYRLTRGAKIA